jgi:hypothetical protein
LVFGCGSGTNAGNLGWQITKQTWRKSHEEIGYLAWSGGICADAGVGIRGQ